MDDRELAETILAHHEAGHTVACLQFEIPIDHVQMDSSWFTGRLTGGHVQVPDRGSPTTPGEAECFAIMCRAGQAAEERWLDRHPGHGRYRSSNGAEDEADALATLQALGATLSPGYALLQARTLVDRQWTRVEAIADLLLARRRLSARQVRQA